MSYADTIETECKADRCTNTVSYGIETRPEVRPKYCSIKCRDRSH